MTSSTTEVDLEVSGNIEVPKNDDDQAFLLGTSTDQANRFAGWMPKWFSGGGNANEATEWISNRRKGMKSWRDFIKTDKFKTPTSIAVAGRRILTNLEQFQSNYACIVVLLFLYCVLTSLLLILALISCVGAFYFVRSKFGNKSVKIGNLEFGPRFQYGAAALLSFPLFYMAGAGSAIFWVIGASIFFVGLHALFYSSETVPGSEFEMEEV